MKSSLIAILIFAAGSLSAVAQNFTTNQNADLVLGQTLFTTNGAAPVTPNSLSLPIGVAADPTSGKVFVADHMNSRVLRYASSSSLANGAAAEAVIGQPNFSSKSPNQGAATPDQNTLALPTAVFVDPSGTLWVADYQNNRVLAYYGASTLLPVTNAFADRVIGQPDYTTNTNDDTSQKLNLPTGLFVSTADTLFVADLGNNRVVGYKLISQSGSNPAADFVVGQTAFGMNGAGFMATQMNGPFAVLVDAGDHLWVSDYFNHRVLRFDGASNLPMVNAIANGVLGQPNFMAPTMNLTATGMSDPWGLAMDESGSLYVADLSYNRVTIYKSAATKPDGAAADLVLGQSDFTSMAASLAANTVVSPAGMAFDTSGRLFVTNYLGGNRVLRFTKPATATTPMAPTVAITGKKKITTSAARLTIKGTASAIGGSVQLVQVKQGKKAYKSAKGTTSWRYKAKLNPGKTVFTVRALGSNGLNSVTAKLTVTRK